MSRLCVADLLSVCLGELYFVVFHSSLCVKLREILLDIFSQLMTYCSSSLEVLQQFFFSLMREELNCQRPVNLPEPIPDKSRAVVVFRDLNRPIR